MITLQDKKIQELERKVGSLVESLSKFDEITLKFSKVDIVLEKINGSINMLVDLLEKNSSELLKHKTEYTQNSLQVFSNIDKLTKDFQWMKSDKLVSFENLLSSYGAIFPSTELCLSNIGGQIKAIEAKFQTFQKTTDSLLQLIGDKSKEIKSLDDKINTLKSEATMEIKATKDLIITNIGKSENTLKISSQLDIERLSKRLNIIQEDIEKKIKEIDVRLTPLTESLQEIKKDFITMLTTISKIPGNIPVVNDYSEKIKTMENSIASIFTLLKKYETGK